MDYAWAMDLGLDTTHYSKPIMWQSFLGYINCLWLGENSPSSYIGLQPGQRSTLQTFDFLVDLHSLCMTWIFHLISSFNQNQIVGLSSFDGLILLGCTIGPLGSSIIKFLPWIKNFNYPQLSPKMKAMWSISMAESSCETIETTQLSFNDSFDLF